MNRSPADHASRRWKRLARIRLKTSYKLLVLGVDMHNYPSLNEVSALLTADSILVGPWLAWPSHGCIL